MSRMETAQSAASAVVANVATAAPSLTGILLWLSEKEINFWVGVWGVFFIWLQAAYVLWKWRRDVRRDRIAAGLNDD